MAPPVARNSSPLHRPDTKPSQRKGPPHSPSALRAELQQFLLLFRQWSAGTQAQFEQISQSGSFGETPVAGGLGILRRRSPRLHGGLHLRILLMKAHHAPRGIPREVFRYAAIGSKGSLIGIDSLMRLALRFMGESETPCRLGALATG